MNATIEAELRLIANDGWELRNLAGVLSEHPFTGLTFAPYISFYALEMLAWLNRVAPNARIPQPQGIDQSLRLLRARIKLFDGDRAGLDGVVRTLSEIEVASTAFFSRPHSGVLGPLKRWLQKDLGMYFCGQHLVCTTHVGIVNSMLAQNTPTELPEATAHDLAQHWHAYSRTVGGFIGWITDATEPLADHTLRHPIVPHLALTFSAEDYKAHEAYGKLARHIGTEGHPVTAAVTWLVAQVNFVHHVLRQIGPSPYGICFKIKFLTVFHALEGLRRLCAILRQRKASRVVLASSEILSLRDSRWLRKQRPLRNAMAHPYNFGAVGAPLVPGEAPLDTVIRHVSDTDVATLDARLCHVLAVMSDQFQALISARSLGGRPVAW